MAKPKGDEFVHFGDRLTLLDDYAGGGYLTADGFSTTQLGTAPSAYSTFAGAVFLLRPQHDYTIAKSLAVELDKAGLTQTEARAKPQFRRRYEEREREIALNAASFQRSLGREARYGMVVQLQHSTSSKYLSVAKQSSEVNKEGRRVVLDRNAGEDAWFRLMPRLRHVHSEGERVHIGDPVLLEHVHTGLGINIVHDGQLLADGRHEAIGAAAPSALKVRSVAGRGGA